MLTQRSIYEAIVVPAPSSVKGVGQRPIEGVGMVYIFDYPNAGTGMYQDGWIACGTQEGLVDFFEARPIVFCGVAGERG